MFSNIPVFSVFVCIGIHLNISPAMDLFTFPSSVGIYMSHSKNSHLQWSICAPNFKFFTFIGLSLIFLKCHYNGHISFFIFHFSLPPMIHHSKYAIVLLLEIIMVNVMKGRMGVVLMWILKNCKIGFGTKTLGIRQFVRIGVHRCSIGVA